MVLNLACVIEEISRTTIECATERKFCHFMLTLTSASGTYVDISKQEPLPENLDQSDSNGGHGHVTQCPWRENDYIAFDEYYNEPIGRSFGNCEIPFVTS